MSEIKRWWVDNYLVGGRDDATRRQVVLASDHDAAVKALTERAEMFHSELAAALRERNALARKIERVRVMSPRTLRDSCDTTHECLYAANVLRALADEEPSDIAQAVAAERERCAVIAETCSGEHHSPGCGCDRVIARAIRNQ